jgi:hypothetical protein
MSEEKSKKALKLKTFDEIKNDTVYEINLFSKKRRPQSKLSVPITTISRINDEDNIEDQVRTKNQILLFSLIIFFFNINYLFI